MCFDQNRHIIEVGLGIIQYPLKCLLFLAYKEVKKGMWVAIENLLNFDVSIFTNHPREENNNIKTKPFRENKLREKETEPVMVLKIKKKKVNFVMLCAYAEVLLYSFMCLIQMLTYPKQSFNL